MANSKEGTAQASNGANSAQNVFSNMFASATAKAVPVAAKANGAANAAAGNKKPAAIEYLTDAEVDEEFEGGSGVEYVRKTFTNMFPMWDNPKEGRKATVPKVSFYKPGTKASLSIPDVLMPEGRLGIHAKRGVPGTLVVEIPVFEVTDQEGNTVKVPFKTVISDTGAKSRVPIGKAKFVSFDGKEAIALNIEVPREDFLDATNDAAAKVVAEYRAKEAERKAAEKRRALAAGAAPASTGTQLG